MLVTPFAVSVSPNVSRLRKSPSEERRVGRSVGLLCAWALAGLATLILVPFARGDRVLGATLPFWLVAAPLLDLAWVERARWARYCASRIGAAARRRREATRGAIRLRH